MSSAVWGLLGTLVGGVITLISHIAIHHLEASDRKAHEEAQVTETARKNRESAYLRLLTAARQLRYQARSVPAHDSEVIDSLRTELSTVNYEIELIASAKIAASADLVRRKTLDYFNAAIKSTATGQSSPDRPKTVVEDRHAARQAVAEFIVEARSDVGPDQRG